MYGVSSVQKWYSDHPHLSFARVIGNNIQSLPFLLSVKQENSGMISCIGRLFHTLLLSEKPCDIAFTLLSVFTNY